MNLPSDEDSDEDEEERAARVLGGTDDMPFRSRDPIMKWREMKEAKGL